MLVLCDFPLLLVSCLIEPPVHPIILPVVSPPGIILERVLPMDKPGKPGPGRGQVFWRLGTQDSDLGRPRTDTGIAAMVFIPVLSVLEQAEGQVISWSKPRAFLVSCQL